MAQDDKIPPAGLHKQLVKKLLDNLESNEDFRAQFQASPEQALRSLGYQAPWECMGAMQQGAVLASPDAIRAQRAKLESSLQLPHTQTCPLELQEGHPAQ